MKFEDAVNACPVRGAIHRPNGIRYWKNHPKLLVEQVPAEDQKSSDWSIHDPRDDDDSSLFMYND